KKKQYLKPAIQEAIFEARFSIDNYDSTIPGQIYNLIKKEYPQKADIYPSPFFVIQRGQNQKAQIPIFQAKNIAETELVQIGAGIVTANHIKYVSWEQFSKTIEKILGAYVETAHPELIQRIGVRYINNFYITEESFNLNDYFNLGLVLPESLRDLQGFDLTVLNAPDKKYSPFNIQSRTRFFTDSLRTAEVGSRFIVDIDCFIENTPEMQNQDILKRAEEAHDYLEFIFESIITDKTRQLMGIIND
ncbi:TPA: TIGR04255 family protein, partial [Legionella pneumophila]|nr:TIGR04255 family protein [Legionella pneumophila]HCE5391726.1 TIGR04255 family protein [Legionella pneumophila]HCE5481353.1 TIGR04255 family protein [Legionella pneumophila]HCE5571345.1 TIGR04255 family protein [Legionella pneumophila]